LRRSLPADMEVARMKRLLLVPVLTVSLILPAAALGGDATMKGGDSTLARGTYGWFGPVDPNGTVGFNVRKTSTGKKVKKFTWVDVPMTCSDGAHLSDVQFLFAMPVKQGEFKGKAVNDVINPTATATAAGKFVSKKKARGTLRVQGDLGGLTGCDTGKRPWKAFKGGPVM
jgi:hypothetical protein